MEGLTSLRTISYDDNVLRVTVSKGTIIPMFAVSTANYADLKFIVRILYG